MNILVTVRNGAVVSVDVDGEPTTFSVEYEDTGEFPDRLLVERQTTRPAATSEPTAVPASAR